MDRSGSYSAGPGCGSGSGKMMPLLGDLDTDLQNCSYVSFCTPCDTISFSSVTRWWFCGFAKRLLKQNVPKILPPMYNIVYCSCAANFSFAQLAKRKSLGRSKPATNSQAQVLQHTVWNVSTISKPYWTAFFRNKLSTTRCEWVRLFISWQVQSAYNSVRSRCWEITALDDKLEWCQIL